MVYQRRDRYGQKQVSEQFDQAGMKGTTMLKLTSGQAGTWATNLHVSAWPNPLKKVHSQGIPTARQRWPEVRQCTLRGARTNLGKIFNVVNKKFFANS